MPHWAGRISSIFLVFVVEIERKLALCSVSWSSELYQRFQRYAALSHLPYDIVCAQDACVTVLYVALGGMRVRVGNIRNGMLSARPLTDVPRLQ